MIEVRINSLVLLIVNRKNCKTIAELRPLYNRGTIDAEKEENEMAIQIHKAKRS